MSRHRLTIDELAAEVGMTTRNVRAYQSRGLVPPPDVVGRTGFYNAEHVDRLELIKRMQAEGLNLNAIAWVLGAAERDSDALRAVREAARAPFATEGTPVIPAATLAARLGGAGIDPDAVARAVELGVIELLDDGNVRILMPALVRRAEELIALGVPLPALLDVVVAMNDHTGELAEVFLGLVRDHLFDRAVVPGQPIDPEAVRIISAQLRAIASDVVVAALERALVDQIDVVIDDVVSGAPPRPASSRRATKARSPASRSRRR